MGLFSNLFKPTTKQVNRSLFSFLVGNAAPDMKGREFLDAYKGWVYAAVTAIAEEVATISLRLERRQGETWEPVKDHIALGPLQTVNPYMSSDELWLTTQSFLELSGESFWYLPQGQLVRKPLEIWPLDPTRMSVVKNDRTVVSGYVYRNEKSVDVPLRANEVLHFKRFNPANRYRGLGTVQAAALAIDTDVYSAEWNRNFFYNAAMPSAVLEADGTLQQEQYDRIKMNWDSRYKGTANAHKLAILEGGLKFKQASLSQRDMEFLAQRQWGRDEILGIFRVPKALLGIAEDFNRANIVGIQAMFARYVVKPRMSFLSSRLTEFYLPLFDLDPRQWRIRYEDPIPADEDQELKRRQTSLAGAAWQTINEIREEQGLDPIADGEKLYVPSTLRSLDQAAEPPPAPTVAPTAAKRPAKDLAEAVTKALKDGSVAGRKNFIRREITKRSPEFEHLLLQMRDALVGKLIPKKGRRPNALKDFDENARSSELIRFLFEDWGDWIGLVLDPTTETLKTSLDFAGREAVAQVGLDQTFDLLNPNAVDWLSVNALQHARSVVGTVKDEVATRVVRGVEQGKGAEDIAESISEFFSEQHKWRALRIARTEVIAGYAQGSLEGYRQSGVVKMKQWLTAGDADVDPECQLNAEQGPISLTATFQTGHEAPPVHPNCRCVLQPVVDLAS